jgi:hypothetical protein
MGLQLKFYEWGRILSHLPWYSIIYSAFLAALSAGTVSAYKKYHGDLPKDANDQMFLYITLIIAWLVTTRPDSALDVHKDLTDKAFEIMTNLLKYTKKINPNSNTDMKNFNSDHPEKLIMYIVTNISSSPSRHTLYELREEDRKKLEESKDTCKILEAFETFQMKQRLALPAPLHGMCVLLVFIFHTLFAPILLYSHHLNLLETVICNFILAIYTTGCLLVAIKLEHPYHDVTLKDENPPTKEFQILYTKIIKHFNYDAKDPNSYVIIENNVTQTLWNDYDFKIEENNYYKKRDPPVTNDNFEPNNTKGSYLL